MTDRLTEPERRYVEGSRKANSAATWLAIIDRLAPQPTGETPSDPAQAEDIRDLRRRVEQLEAGLAYVDNSVHPLALIRYVFAIREGCVPPTRTPY